MSESIRRMIDTSVTPKDFHHAAVLVQRHIRENEGPYENSVLVNMLMLKCVALTATIGCGDPKAWYSIISGIARDAMATYHTNPPGQRTAA